MGKIKEQAYLIFFLCNLFIKFTPDMSGYIEYSIAGIACVFWCVKYALTAYTAKEHVLNVIIILVCMISLFSTGYQGLFLSALAIVGAKDINIEKLFKSSFVLGVLCITISIAYHLYIYQGIDVGSAAERSIFEVTFMTKNSFGYNHANYLFLLIYTLIMLYLYLKFYTLTKIDYLLVTIIAIIGFFFTYSRTGILIFLSSIFLVFIFKSKFGEKSYLRKVIEWIPTAVIALSFLLPYIFQKIPSSLLSKLNILLSGRIYLSAEFLAFFETTVWGQNVEDISGYAGYYLVCDNSFVSMLVTYGVIVFALFVMGSLMLRNIKLDNRDWIIIVGFFMYGFTECNFTIAFVNFAFIYFTKALYSQKKTTTRKIFRYRIFFKRSYK